MRLTNESPKIKIIYFCGSATSSSPLSSLTHTDYTQVKTRTRRKKSRVSTARCYTWRPHTSASALRASLLSEPFYRAVTQLLKVRSFRPESSAALKQSLIHIYKSAAVLTRNPPRAAAVLEPQHTCDWSSARLAHVCLNNTEWRKRGGGEINQSFIWTINQLNEQ